MDVGATHLGAGFSGPLGVILQTRFFGVFFGDLCVPRWWPKGSAYLSERAECQLRGWVVSARVVCAAEDACNPHHFFMPWVDALASVHHFLGGNMAALTVMELGVWFVLYLTAVNLLAFVVSPPVARWTAGIGTYLLTGLLTLGLTFYAISPATNGLGVAYLTLIWPLWIWGHVGVPAWLAPYLFSFTE